jgi:hypothetical protein
MTPVTIACLRSASAWNRTVVILAIAYYFSVICRVMVVHDGNTLYT